MNQIFCILFQYFFFLPEYLYIKSYNLSCNGKLVYMSLLYHIMINLSRFLLYFCSKHLLFREKISQNVRVPVFTTLSKVWHVKQKPTATINLRGILGGAKISLKQTYQSEIYEVKYVTVHSQQIYKLHS